MNYKSLLNAIVNRLPEGFFDYVGVDYPGFIHVSKLGRHFNIGRDYKVWAIDTYNSKIAYSDRSEPNLSDNLPIPDETTDPEIVAEGIVSYVEKIVH